MFRVKRVNRVDKQKELLFFCDGSDSIVVPARCLTSPNPNEHPSPLRRGEAHHGARGEVKIISRKFLNKFDFNYLITSSSLPTMVNAAIHSSRCAFS